MKYFRMSYEEVVFNRSYINIILLNRSIPSYDYDREEENEEDTTTPRVKRVRTGKTHYSHENGLFESLM